MKFAPTGRETATWHFVNIEIGSKGYDPRRDCADDNCVVAQIDRDMAVLRDPHAPHAAQAEALRFLIHFVGDLHQPLHAADRHDKGGNRRDRAIRAGARTNLHRVWDEDVVEALGPDPWRDRGQHRGRLVAAGQSAASATGTPADWANESFPGRGAGDLCAPAGYGPVRLPRDYARRRTRHGARSNWPRPACGWRRCSTRFIADRIGHRDRLAHNGRFIALTVRQPDSARLLFARQDGLRTIG